MGMAASMLVIAAQPWLMQFQICKPVTGDCRQNCFVKVTQVTLVRMESHESI
jgi:hypothetical protein